MSGTLYILCQMHIKRGGVQMTSSSLSERGYGCVRGWQEGEPDAGMRKGTIGFLSIVGYRKRYWVSIFYVECILSVEVCNFIVMS